MLIAMLARSRHFRRHARVRARVREAVRHHDPVGFLPRARRLRLPGLRHAASGALLIAMLGTTSSSTSRSSPSIVATSLPLGRYIWKVFTDQRTWLDPVLGPDRAARPAADRASIPPSSRTGSGTRVSLLVSNVVMWVVDLRRSSRSRRWLPLNPDGIADMEPTLAFNTISSFTTNTNLQHYSGETGLSYLLADVRHHVPAVRDGRHGHRRLHRHHPRTGAATASTTLGNFYVDLHARHGARVPAAGAAGGRAPGVAGHADDVRRRRHGDDGRRRTTQTIARGVVAPRGRHQAARHERRRLLRAQLGASLREPDAAVEPRRDVVDHDHPDGDGLDARPSASAAAGSRSCSSRRCWPSTCRWSSFGVAEEARGNPRDRARSASTSRPARWRARKCGSAPALSALWAVTTTVTSNGSVNAMHDSLTPLGGLMPMVGMWLNNIFGGVGVGFINMLHLRHRRRSSSPA